tara:strand:- start:2040 stop:2480 length:441 start_codon:yes stop_codon:yes gene_type:complete
MPVKSFKGLIADDSTTTIALHTTNGSVGYKIKKFEIMPSKIGVAHQNAVVQIFTIDDNTAPNTTIDFSSQTLLAAARYVDRVNVEMSEATIFDNMTFNQDIYIKYKDADAATEINYYIELETVKLALDENTVATLKDIRNIEGRIV